MTIKGKKSGPDSWLKQIANTRARPALRGEKEGKKSDAPAHPFNSKLPFTSKDQPFTHEWVN